MKEDSSLRGVIFIPITAGKATTMMMVPIFDHYDVYEVHDPNNSDRFVVAYARGKTKL